jgi:hypothetical protein
VFFDSTVFLLHAIDNWKNQRAASSFSPHLVFFLAAFSRFRLALLRQVAEQNRSRFVPQIAAPQDRQRVFIATIGI